MPSTEFDEGDNMHPTLKTYLDDLGSKYPDKSFPGFCPEYSRQVAIKAVLAVLQDPGNSGAQRTGVCSIHNPDPTAKRQRRMLESLSIDPAEVLFWNFFPFYDLERTQLDFSDKVAWAEELRALAMLLTNLRVIVVSGARAWDGMKYFEPISGVRMLWTPHPSNRGMLAVGSSHYETAWKRARDIIRLPSKIDAANRKGGRRSAFSGKGIYRLKKENPRRKNTHGWRSWEAITHDGMVYEDYLKAGGRRKDLAWDVEHNHAEVR